MFNLVERGPALLHHDFIEEVDSMTFSELVRTANSIGKFYLLTFPNTHWGQASFLLSINKGHISVNIREPKKFVDFSGHNKKILRKIVKQGAAVRELLRSFEEHL